MKFLSAALAFGLFISGFCFAQTQTGNASYNPAKNGLTIAHSSMSFGTRVRVTNLRNNQEVIATVDGRIPVSDPRIADISAEAGNAIGMSARGYTEIRLEQLAHLQAAEPAPAEVIPTAVSASPAGGSAAPAPVSSPSSSRPVREPPDEPAPAAAVPAQPQYLIAAPAAMPGDRYCISPPLGIAILILLIIIALLLTAILVLLLSARRICWWFRRHSVWVRRHFRYILKRRYQD